MINVRAMANNMTSMVNPNMDAVLRVNLGYTVDADGNQVPDFQEQPIKIQAQSLESKEKDHLGLVDRQGEFITAYTFGNVNAIQRWLNRGASELVFIPYGETDPVRWNVDKVLESYRTWVRLLLVRIT